jgi:hypothetical protein
VKRINQKLVLQGLDAQNKGYYPGRVFLKVEPDHCRAFGYLKVNKYFNKK